MVSRVIQPELPSDPIEQVEIEAVFFNAFEVIVWRELELCGLIFIYRFFLTTPCRSLASHAVIYCSLIQPLLATGAVSLISVSRQLSAK